MAKDLDPDKVYGSYSCHLCKHLWQKISIRTMFKAATLVICAESDAKRSGSGQGLTQLLLSSVPEVMQQMMPKDVDPEKV